MRARSHIHALACLALAAACGETGEQIQQRIGEQLQQQLTSSDKKRPEEPDRLPPELVVNKLRLYVDCLNQTRVPLYAGFRRGAAAFAGHGKDAPEPVPPEALGECDKAEREGPLLQPKLPALQQAAVAYHAAARAFAGEIDAVREDMAQKPSVVLREGEQGPVYERFTAAFRAWDDARRDLDEQIDANQTRLDDELLAKIEARSGKGLEWHTRQAILKAKPYIRCLGDHDEYTAAVCELYLAGFRASYADFRAAFESDPTAAKVFWLPQFAGSLAEFAAAADGLSAAIREDKARSGQIGEVVREYNDALRDSGSVNFRTAG